MQPKNWELVAYKLWKALEKVGKAGDVATVSQKHYKDMVTEAERSRYLLIDSDTIEALENKYKTK